MATELENCPKLQRFIELLAALNHQTVEMIKTGNTAHLTAMNDTVEEMYSIQHGQEDEVFTAIEEDMQIICKNFNAIVTMIKSNDGEKMDGATSLAVKKFLHNIFDADVRIVYAYGLA